MNRFPNINSTGPSVEPRRSRVRAESGAAIRRVSVSRWRALEAKQFRALVAAPRQRAQVQQLGGPAALQLFQAAQVRDGRS